MAEGGAANSREAVVDAGAVEMLSIWECVDNSRDAAAPVEPGLCREKGEVRLARKRSVRWL